MLMKVKLRLTLFVAIALGYFLAIQYYYRGYLTRNQFIIISMALALLLPYMILTLREYRCVSRFPEINLRRVEFFLSPFVFLSALLEMQLLGHIGFFTATVLVCGLTFLLFSKSRANSVFGANLLLATIIAVLYGKYTPTFGNDTWRDTTQALQIIERGGLRELSITHPAYPLPVVSVLYAIHSMIANFNTLWSSSIIGLIYLILITLWVYVIARRSNVKYTHIPAILLHSVSIVIIWSVWFVPQAYAVLMAIPLIFLDLSPVITLIFSIGMVLGHGGMSLWTLIILTLIVLAKKILKHKNSIPKSAIAKVVIVFLILISYAIYTTLSMALKGATTTLIDTIMTFLSGEKVVATRNLIQKPVSTVLEYIPIVVLALLGIVTLVEHRDILVRLLSFVSLAGLGISFVAATINPTLFPTRYLSLGSLIVLAILSPQAIEALTRRGRAGTFYTLSLLLLAIIFFAFSGTLMPGNPYTVSLISGVLTYDEARVLEDIAPVLCCNNYLIDWRAGAYLRYEYLWIQAPPSLKEFHVLETQATFIFAGYYGLYVTPEYLAKYNGMLIFRKSALRMLEVYSPDIELFLYNVTYHGASLLYNSHLIRIYLLQY